MKVNNMGRYIKYIVGFFIRTDEQNQEDFDAGFISGMVFIFLIILIIFLIEQQ